MNLACELDIIKQREREKRIAVENNNITISKYF